MSRQTDDVSTRSRRGIDRLSLSDCLRAGHESWLGCKPGSGPVSSRARTPSWARNVGGGVSSKTHVTDRVGRRPAGSAAARSLEWGPSRTARRHSVCAAVERDLDLTVVCSRTPLALASPAGPRLGGAKTSSPRPSERRSATALRVLVVAGDPVLPSSTCASGATAVQRELDLRQVQACSNAMLARTARVPQTSSPSRCAVSVGPAGVCDADRVVVAGSETLSGATSPNCSKFACRGPYRAAYPRHGSSVRRMTAWPIRFAPCLVGSQIGWPTRLGAPCVGRIPTARTSPSCEVLAVRPPHGACVRRSPRGGCARRFGAFLLVATCKPRRALDRDSMRLLCRDGRPMGTPSGCQKYRPCTRPLVLVDRPGSPCSPN
jgi:hypothetical protein